jgi:hypothetical protein
MPAPPPVVKSTYVEEAVLVPAVSFSYTPANSNTTQTFSVPPLDATELISTQELTGVADTAALTVIPRNKNVCSGVPVISPPSTFDFRQEFWDYLSPIINQGNCGSCWAIASTQSFASRKAFFTNQKVRPLSAAYMIYCTAASFSVQSTPVYGCSGGSLVEAFWFTNVNGVVTEDCVRYDLQLWEPGSEQVRRRKLGAVGVEVPETQVSCPLSSCPNNELVQPWSYRTAISYIVAGTPRQSGGSEANIRQEIWFNGPVASGYQVRQDFIDYWRRLLEGKASGAEFVYTPAPETDDNPLIGNHAVQLVGWGNKWGSEYWIIANSWGATNTGSTQADLEDYGNNGYFLMARGSNAVAIESNVVTGIPRMHPNVVGATGMPTFVEDQRMCDLIAYEINLETIAAMHMVPPIGLPAPKTMYGWILPPINPQNVGRVRRFDKCPEDRPFHCATTGVCVQVPDECGTEKPTQGRVKHTSQIDPLKAAAREASKQWKIKELQKKGLKSNDNEMVQQEVRNMELLSSTNAAKAACSATHGRAELCNSNDDSKMAMIVGFSVLGTFGLVVFALLIWLAVRIKKANVT